MHDLVWGNGLGNTLEETWVGGDRSGIMKIMTGYVGSPVMLNRRVSKCVAYTSLEVAQGCTISPT